MKNMQEIRQKVIDGFTPEMWQAFADGWTPNFSMEKKEDGDYQITTTLDPPNSPEEK